MVIHKTGNAWRDEAMKVRTIFNGRYCGNGVRLSPLELRPQRGPDAT
jgi:hypothetical protein